MRQSFHLTLVFAIAFLAVSGISSAAVTDISLYHLGENDPGASSGNVGNATTIDAVGANNLSQTGSPVYSNDTIAAGSTLSMRFDGTDSSPQRYASSSVISSATDNFGIEVLVRADRAAFGTSYSLLAYNGDTGGGGGWGLYRDGNYYRGLFGAVTFVSGIDAVPGAWTDLALVRASGITTLYADGYAIGTSTATPVGPANTGFRVGGNAGGDENFRGSVDNVRVFTFAPGAFNAATDLHVGFKDLAGYRFGEQDAGAANGVAGNATTADLLGAHNLTKGGTGQTYSNATAGGGTSLGMHFTGSSGEWYSTNAFSTITDNLRLEAWVSADNTTDTAVVAYNGITGGPNGGGGYGIFQHGSHWMVLYGNVFLQDFGDITVNQLTHLALERENGVGRFFIDGVQAGGDFYAAPNPVTGDFMVGGNSGSNLEHFRGLIDEVRLVEIVPEPSTLALLATGLIGLLAYAWRKRR